MAKRKKRPVGRPHSCTQQRIDHICTALGVGATIRDAANYAGVGTGTYHRWLEYAEDEFARVDLDPDELPENWRALIDEAKAPFCELRDRSSRARAEFKVQLLGAALLASTGSQGVPSDGRVALKMLAMRDHEYAERRQHEHSGPKGKPIAVEVYDAIRIPAEDPEQ